MLARVAKLVASLGALRVLLATLTIFVVACAPFSDGPTAHTGWRLLTTAIAPALFVMLVFLLPLDMMMSKLFMSAEQGAGRERLKRIIRVEVVLLLALLVAWGPLVVRLLRYT